MDALLSFLLRTQGTTPSSPSSWRHVFMFFLSSYTHFSICRVIHYHGCLLIQIFGYDSICFYFFSKKYQKYVCFSHFPTVTNFWSTSSSSIPTCHNRVVPTCHQNMGPTWQKSCHHG
jgi:hypothetical protein